MSVSQKFGIDRRTLRTCRDAKVENPGTVSIVQRNLFMHQQKIGCNVQPVRSGSMHEACGRPNGLDNCMRQMPSLGQGSLGLGLHSVFLSLQKVNKCDGPRPR